MYSSDNFVNYDVFASGYSSSNSEVESAIQVLEQLVLQYLHTGAHILDIGCAHGSVIKALHTRGYQTTGIDISEKLLRIARTNVPSGKFILGDIRKLDLQPIYDAVISIDVFCHILNLEELATVFQKVYTAMSCNSIFAFTTPIVEEAWLTTIFENRPNFEYFNRIIEHDTSILIERYYNHNQEEKLREVKFTSLELINEVWQRSDSTMIVKDYFISEITSALANAGFIEINKYGSRDFGDDGPVSAPLFVCRKPSVLQ